MVVRSGTRWLSATVWGSKPLPVSCTIWLSIRPVVLLAVAVRFECNGAEGSKASGTVAVVPALWTTMLQAVADARQSTTTSWVPSRMSASRVMCPVNAPVPSLVPEVFAVSEHRRRR